MPGPPLRGIFSPLRDVDDVDREVGELGAERRGEVVAAALDEDEVERRELARPASSMAARFIEASSRIAVCGQPPVSTPTMRPRRAPRADQELGVLAGVDVVGDGGDLVALAHPLAERVDEARLARADRAADADPQNVVFHASRLLTDRNSRVYWVSCRRSRARRRAGSRRSRRRGRRRAAATAAGISAPSASSRRCPAIWPSGTSFTAAAPGSRARPRRSRRKRPRAGWPSRRRRRRRRSRTAVARSRDGRAEVREQPRERAAHRESSTRARASRGARRACGSSGAPRPRRARPRRDAGAARIGRSSRAMPMRSTSRSHAERRASSCTSPRSARCSSPCE